MQPGGKVLHVNSHEEKTDYRKAIGQVLWDIKNQRDITLIRISELTSIDAKTIRNAAGGEHCLQPTSLARLGQCFGPEALNPFANLFGGRIVPLEAKSDADILPFITRAAMKIVEARSPDSPTGIRETHTEKLGYLHDLLALQRELEAKIQEIRSIAA